MSIADSRQLLEGVRVLDLSQYIPGPFASMKMLQQGAQVIKIEPPGGDPMRRLGGDDTSFSPLYRHLNHGKRIVELDLKTEGGRERFTDLLNSADVLLEGFRPGTVERLGFPLSTLHNINPGLVVCRLSGFGQQGELAQRSGHDLGYAVRAGMYSQPPGHSRPQLIYPPVADHASGLDGLFMICAALFSRTRNGIGCELDVSMYGALSEWQYMFESESFSRELTGALACYNIYQTADDCYVSLAALEPKFWKNFCNAVGRIDWIARQHEGTPQSGLIEELQTMFMGWPQYLWKEKLHDVDCCFEVIELPDKLLDQVKSGKSAMSETRSALQLVQAESISWSDE